VAAVALLQVRISFAACLASEDEALQAVSWCCEEHFDTTDQVKVDRGALVQRCNDQCVRPTTLLKSRTERKTAISNAPAWTKGLPLVYAASATRSGSPSFRTGPPVAHELHYLLQRLLI